MTASNAAVVNISLLYKDTNTTVVPPTPAMVLLDVYSFALKPEEHQPSGTCNFSRIDNAVLNMNFKGADAASRYQLLEYTPLTTTSSVS